MTNCRICDVPIAHAEMHTCKLTPEKAIDKPLDAIFQKATSPSALSTNSSSLASRVKQITPKQAKIHYALNGRRFPKEEKL